jgi:hypothetical protein
LPEPPFSPILNNGSFLREPGWRFGVPIRHKYCYVDIGWNAIVFDNCVDPAILQAEGK